MAEHSGLSDDVPSVLYQLAVFSWWRGDWDQALGYFERATKTVRTLGYDKGSISSWVSLVRGRISLARGEAQTAHEWLQAAIEQSEGPDTTLIPICVHAALGEADLVHQDAAAALTRLDPWVERTSPYEQEMTELIPLVTWACLELGEVERATDLLAECMVQARGRKYPVLQADALRIQALLALRQGHWHDAAAALDEALMLARAMPYPYGEANALFVCGNLHAAHGEPERAREQYEAALAILGQLGERLYAEQVERALAVVSRS